MTNALDSFDSTYAMVVGSLQGNMYPPGRRIQLEVAYCNLVIEHYRGIAHLLGVNATASAMSLARPIYEALVKGLWLYYCASDDQLEKHAEGQEIDDTKNLLTYLSATSIPDVVVKSLAQIRTKYWKALCSLTHAGHTQLRYWINPTTGVEANYPNEALLELANFASFMLLVAGRELAIRASNIAAVDGLTQLLPDCGGDA